MSHAFRADNRDVLAYLPWILLPYDSLTHLMGFDFNSSAQTLPLTALVSVPYIIFRRGNLCLSTECLELAKFVTGLTIFFVLISLGNVFFEATGLTSTELDTRLAASSRQFFSFFLGLSSLFMFADAAQRITKDHAFKLIVYSGLPTLLFVALQFFTGRFTLVENRVQGFSSEPSHLCDFLVYAFIPACLAVTSFGRKKWLLILFSLLALGLTYSSSGYIKFLFLIICLFIAYDMFLRGALAMALLLVVGYSLLLLNPENYIFSMVSSIFNNFDNYEALVLNASLVDRFFGFFGPLSQLNTVHGFLGHGFGGDGVYFYRLFHPDVADTIASVKGNLLSIPSLQGKVLMYGGLAGYSVYLYVWYFVWKHADGQLITRCLLAAIFAGSLFSLGPFFLPYIWMWWAIAITKQ